MSRRRRQMLVTIPFALAVALSGCATGAPAEIASGTGELMQSTVVTAAEQAAAGDSAGALATLDALQEQLDTASSAGDLSASRATAIQGAIDQVRSDLRSAPEVAPTNAPATTDGSGGTESVTGGPGNGGKNDKGDDRPDKPDKPGKDK
ncbi:hypothetical protein [Herbiconiux ginsengi]|uniref:Mucin-associated surface protein n=1 Tax=Herbiconiux ginsengi TaxID=381665 RepID=A0A1H3QAI0_9MICO|nr:hypothetical protein [Herbiconiux ginsengi]SDZ10260.1 hypothetical protein SAMN05216554_2406 [Herbiconiux ginsengi]